MRLVGPNGEQVGIVRVEDALRLAQEADLDLVEVAPQARPPVCKLMDFGKFKYESAIKDREARKNQAHTVLKEIRLRLKIDPHDYSTKKGHVERFLNEGDKVKVMIMFRGREQSRPEMGYRLLQRMAADVVELGYIESNPKQDGRNMVMVIGPNKKKADAKAEQKDIQAEQKAERAARRRQEAAQAAEKTAEVAEANEAAETAVPDAASDEEPIFIKRATPPPSALPPAASSSGPPAYSSSRPDRGGPRSDRPGGSRPPYGSGPDRGPRPDRGERPSFGTGPGGPRGDRPSGPRPDRGERPSFGSGPGSPSSRPATTGTPRPVSSGPGAGAPAAGRPATGPRPLPATGPRPTPGAVGPRPSPGSIGPRPTPGPGPRPTPGPGPRPAPGPGPRPAPGPAAEAKPSEAKPAETKPTEEAAKPAATPEQTSADA
ncbi:translation initiation factor IF-3 [Kineosporia sp. NBRC 101731]|uniref:translation initiation factor IF-3 n=1 Tax=Kineosporia sp. NBRC 101731 TaxID=3032199 RepID=UPI00249FE536|nr:hypothetical protein Kisp02_70830 [Kineosporia sp. NBRC 101731]